MGRKYALKILAKVAKVMIKVNNILIMNK